MTNITIREADHHDIRFVEKLMDKELSKYYGGDHKAHANRIFSCHIDGGIDKIGFFSLSQKMFIAEADGEPAGMIHLVLKRQNTCKISPLIVKEEFRGNAGIGRALVDKALKFATEKKCRQLYCTVSDKNDGAKRFFLKHEFSIAGRSQSQYLDGVDELMLYRQLREIITEEEFDFDHISVLELDSRHKEQVRDMLLDVLPETFSGLDDSWVDALFRGHDRRKTMDVEQKFKIIFTATDRNDRVLGIVGATPKKGEPIKLMPFVALEPPAFFALLSDVPMLLKSHGRKVYVHIYPTSEQVRFLQRFGWKLDALLPDSYKTDGIIQQWSLDIDGGGSLKFLRLKNAYLNMMRKGDKSLEVRVGYRHVKAIKKGDDVVFHSPSDRLVKTVTDVRSYQDIASMLSSEDHSKILSGFTYDQVSKKLHEIYPPEKETYGVYVFDVA